MRERKKADAKAADPSAVQKVAEATPVPLCRYEELALRENRLRQADAQRDKD